MVYIYLHLLYIFFCCYWLGIYFWSPWLLSKLFFLIFLFRSWEYNYTYDWYYFFMNINMYLNLYLSNTQKYSSFQITTTIIPSIRTWIQTQMDLLHYILKKYAYTINHKRLAINYLIVALWTGLSGTLLATFIRWELAYPGSHFFKGDSLRYLQVITAHGLTMVFFVVVPLVFGFFANFFMPYHVGSKDVAFPRLNNLGFWLFPAGYVLVAKPAFLRPTITKYFDKPTLFYQLVQPTNNLQSLNTVFSKQTLQNQSLDFLQKFLFSETILNFWELTTTIQKERRKKVIIAKCNNSILTMSGWTFITPFSGNLRFTGVGAQDVAILSVLLAGVSTTISFTNLLMTRRTLSMPGLQNRRVLIPFMSITLFLVMRMLALITPVLGAAMIMLALDRHWGTSFFDYAYGGDVILFHHLFWFFGHPEVYVVLIPAFGIVNSLLPFYTSRRIASKHHLIWATYIMGYMGFLVWGHHMYLVGLDHRSRSMYSTITVMISLPAIVKLVNWTLTFLNSLVVLTVPFLFFLSFFFFFLSGGLTGLWLSHVGLNLFVHDTFYVVAHFHFMFSAATFTALFAGIYHYYKIIFGVTYSSNFSYLHLIYWTCGQWLTFLPLFWVGYNGLPRRYHDYPLIYFSWHGLSSTGHILTLLGILFFFLELADSHFKRTTEIPTFYHLSRTNKRLLFYFYKIFFLKFRAQKNFYISLKTKM